MATVDIENLNPPELLETLHGYPFLADFSLSLNTPDGRLLAFRGTPLKLCQPIGNWPACGNDCSSEMQRAISEVLTRQRPKVLRCPLGLLWAVIPLQVEEEEIGYLVCSGRRETLIDLDDVRSLMQNRSGQRETLMSEWKNLPAISREDIEAIAAKTHDLLNTLLCTSFSTFALHKNLNRLKSIAGITAEIDGVKSRRTLCEILDETLSILFDVPKIVYLLPCENRPGHFEIVGRSRRYLTEKQLAGLHRRLGKQPRLLEAGENGELPPFLGNARRCYSIPLRLENRPLGHLFLCDVDLYPQDLVLIDLLIGRVCAKLLHIMRKEEMQREKSLSSRLFNDIARLSRCSSRRELYRQLLELSAKLLGATKGSVMLCDENRKSLRIEAAIGMNNQLAQRLNVQIGGSYAGRVLTEGSPLLIENIEKQSDLGFNSRPRFRTKSFLSFPLRDGDTTVGVLNLSDKKDGGLFTDRDKDHIAALTASFSGLLRGVTAQERVGRLEELSMTDPLTGLHNRRFLQQRMEEELSRGSRQGLSLSVMMIDLDYFKKYNDMCGHLAGDKALEKFAAILKKSSRTMDVVTRFGGEEFCIILPGACPDETELVAARIQEAIDRERFVAEELLPTGRLTASIGIAFYPRHGKTSRALINAADTALYAAKTAGRNAIRLYEEERSEKRPGESDSTTSEVDWFLSGGPE